MSDRDAPLFDDAGINLADPHDRRGQKTRYISELQAKALRRILGPVSGVAIDVGCGYGRMTRQLAALGFDRVIGIDPSERVLTAAKALHPEVNFVVGQLPMLPIRDESARCIFLLNVLRALHLMNVTSVASGVVRTIAPGGRLVILDNIRSGHAQYLSEQEIVALFESAGLRLSARRAIRGSRWPWIYLIRYGLFPERWHGALAALELAWMSAFQRAPFVQYVNVIWVFDKT